MTPNSVTPLFGNPLDALDPLIDAANFVLDIINALLSGDVEFLADTFSSLILLLPNLILWVVFKLFVVITGVFYDFLLAATTRAPVPQDSSGEAVIFAEPADADTFGALQATIEESIVPVALVFVVVGIAIVLFIRVFDVVIEFSFNSEEAQRRLLLAPILISLWVPLANMILVMAMGLTELFLSIEVTGGGLSTAPDGIDADEGINATTLLESGATGSSDGLSDNPIDFIAETGSSDGVATLFRLLYGIWMSLFIVPVAIIAAFLAILRLVMLYVLYVLGPIGIMMWAITWRDIGSLGEKIVRYFILLALFPIPAALVSVLLPVIAIGVEDAIMGAIDSNTPSQASGVADFLGFRGIIRTLLAGIVVVVIGFAPWALVIGVGKATALAGGAAVAGGAIATGGTAMVAGGAMKASTSAPGAAGKAASLASSGTKKVGGGVASKGKDLANEHLDEQTLSNIQNKREKAGKLRDDISSKADPVTNPINRGVGSARSGLNSARETAGENLERAKKSGAGQAIRTGVGDVKERYGELEDGAIARKGGQALSSGLRTAGFRETARVVDKSSEAIGKQKKLRKKQKEGRKEFRKKLDKRKVMDDDEALQEELAGDYDDKELELTERAVARELDKAQVKELAASSDKLNWDEEEVDQMFEEGRFTDELDEAGERVVGNAAMREALEAESREELGNQLNPRMAEQLEGAMQFDLDEEEMLEIADRADGISESDIVNNEDFMNRFRHNEVDNLNPVTNERRWMLDAISEDYDEEKALKAVGELESNSESITEKGLKSADESEMFEVNDPDKIADEYGDQIAKGYKEGSLDNMMEEEIIPSLIEGDDPLIDVSDEMMDENGNVDTSGLSKELQSNIEDQVGESIENSDQIQMHFKDTIDGVSLSELPDNTVEEAINVDPEGDKDFEVDMDKLGPHAMDSEQMEERIQNQTMAQREAAMKEIMKEQKEVVERGIQNTDFTRGKPPEEVEEIRNEILGDVESDIVDSVEMVKDEEAKMLADHMNAVNDELVESMKNDYDLADKVAEEAQKGELGADRIKESTNMDNVQDMMKMEFETEISDYIQESFDNVSESVDETIHDAVTEMDSSSVQEAFKNIESGDREAMLEEAGLSQEDLVE